MGVLVAVGVGVAGIGVLVGTSVIVAGGSKVGGIIVSVGVNEGGSGVKVGEIDTLCATIVGVAVA